jgi:glucose-1-phosphate thymidylyltransferase
MKAVILAAGEGRRLKPLTNRRPKPMLSVAGKPLLEYVVEATRDAGIDDIVLVVGYRRDRIQTHFGDGDDWDVDVEYAVQDNQLGTGHAVLQAADLVEDPFVVLNGDQLVDADGIASVAETLGSGDDRAVMTVARSSEPQRYGVVHLEGERAVDIEEKPTDPTTEVFNAGIYGFAPGVFDSIRATDTGESGELAITDVLQRLVPEDEVRTVRYRGTWTDVTHLWDVTRVTGEVLDRTGGRDDGVREAGARVADATYVGRDSRVGANATVRRGTSLGDNVTVGANAVLTNSVVLADATIGDGAVLADSVVAENAHVGANVTVAGGPADVVVEGGYHEDVPLGAVVGDNARVEGGATLAPGTVVGDDATVEAGAVVRGTVPPGTEVRRG